MGTINKSGIDYLISKDYDKIFLDNFMAETPQFNQIMNVIPSKDSYNKFAGFTGVGLIPKKTEGVNAIFATPKQKFAKTFIPDTFSLGVRITKEAFDDDKSGNLRKLPEMLGKSARATIETDIASMLLDRMQTAGYTGGDGKVLSATDHPLYGSSSTTSASNRPVTNVDLSVSAIEAAVPALRTTVNDQGIPTGLKAKFLLYHPDNWATVVQILQNQEKAGTANRDTNAIKTLGLIPVPLDYATDTDAWAIVTDKSDHQLMLVMREAVSTKSYPAPDNTDDAIYRVRFRKVEGWVSWLGFYGSAGI